MLFLVVATIILSTSIYLYIRSYIKKKTEKMAKAFLQPYDPNWKIKDRKTIIQDLSRDTFDILVIGGGSSGLGCVLDASTRGLKVGLVEADDFGSGTSSKSTKLLHGGVRYLEKAVNNLDSSQFKLVVDALNERKTVMDACPYLSRSVEIMFPIYRRIMVIYYYIGLKLYDWMSGSQSLGPSRFLSREETINKFQKIRKEGLVGSVVYKDGQFDDAKYSVMIALTAVYFGASVLNHCAFRRFVRENGKIVGVVVFDKIESKEFTIKTKTVLNTTGQFADNIRHLAEKDDKKLLAQSSGTHIVMPADFGPTNMGFVDPGTADGRLAFLLPYKGKVLFGGTDIRCAEEPYATPKEDDLKFLMHEIDFYTNRSIVLQRKDILSIWTGIRPLIKDNSKESTEKIVRKHLIYFDDDGMVTLTGGKWTIYRFMAEQAIDAIISRHKFRAERKCVTKFVRLLGAQTYTSKTKDEIRDKLNIPEDIAEHLSTSYGTRAFLISNYIKGSYTRLIHGYPFIKEEIFYQMEHEMASKISDVLFNRLSISYIDVRTAAKLVEVVGRVMKEHLKWSNDFYEVQCTEANRFLDTTGLSLLTGQAGDPSLIEE